MFYQMLVPWLLILGLCATLGAAQATAQAPSLEPSVVDASGQANVRDQAYSGLGAVSSTGASRHSPRPSLRISGTVEQVEALPAPQDGMLEVFVRDPANGLLVAIVPKAWGEYVVVGQSVDFAARPDGMQSYRDRSGLSRTVPRVKAAQAPAATTSGVGDLSLLLGVLILLMVGFGAVSIIVARSRASSRPLVDFDDDAQELGTLVDKSALPDDPADALSELSRRSVETSP
jgi:hypothetical protein